LTEETTASSFPDEPARRVGSIAKGAALVGRIGADPRDDEELRQKKALLVLLAVLIGVNAGSVPVCTFEGGQKTCN